MFFDGFRKHTNAKLNPALLWEYALEDFDFQAMRNVVVQRVIERGWIDDWYAILNLYEIPGVKEAIRQIPYMNAKDMNFVSVIFHIPFNEMECYKRKQSRPAHWDS